MDGQIKKVGLRGQPGIVSRVDPGRLVYVDVPSLGGTFPVKPDKFALTSPDGSVRTYKGEPFRQIGIDVGTKVEVVSDKRQVGHVVVWPPKQKKSLVRRILKTYDF